MQPLKHSYYVLLLHGQLKYMYFSSRWAALYVCSCTRWQAEMIQTTDRNMSWQNATIHPEILRCEVYYGKYKVTMPFSYDFHLFNTAYISISFLSRLWTLNQKESFRGLNYFHPKKIIMVLCVIRYQPNSHSKQGLVEWGLLWYSSYITANPHFVAMLLLRDGLVAPNYMSTTVEVLVYCRSRSILFLWDSHG